MLKINDYIINEEDIVFIREYKNVATNIGIRTYLSITLRNAQVIQIEGTLENVKYLNK